MVSIVGDKFSGMAPRLSSLKLAENLAKLARDTKFDRGRIDPWKAPSAEEVIPALTESAIYWQGSWIYSNNRRDYVPSPLPHDKWDRLYYTDEDYPRYRVEGNEYRLGIPRPDLSPVVTVIDDGDTSNEILMETWSYVVTYVDNYGTEGPPSPTSDLHDVGPGAVVEVAMPEMPDGNYPFSSGIFRVYRSNAGTQAAAYQFLADVLMPTATYTDNTPSHELQEVIPSTNWIGPPDDDVNLFPNGPLQGLTELPNGVMAGYVENTLYFSEPYLPHAWPVSNRRATSHHIRGIAPVQNGMFVATDDNPYMVIGSTPDSFVLVPLESSHQCISTDSVVDMGNYAIYATTQGLAGVSGNQTILLTEDIFNQETWEAYEPSTLRGFRWEQYYVGVWGADNNVFLFDPTGDTHSFSELSTSLYFGFNEPTTDEFHVIWDDNGVKTRGIMEGGATKTFRWESKDFLLPKAVPMVAVRVEAEEYPVTLSVYADTNIIATLSIQDEKAVRLPSGWMSKRWSYVVEADKPVDVVVLASSMREVV